MEAFIIFSLLAFLSFFGLKEHKSKEQKKKQDIELLREIEQIADQERPF